MSCILSCFVSTMFSQTKCYRLRLLTGMEIPNPLSPFDGLHHHRAVGQSDSGICHEWCVHCIYPGSCMDYTVFWETQLHCGYHGILYNRFAVVQERVVHWANQQSEIIQELGKVNA